MKTWLIWAAFMAVGCMRSEAQAESLSIFQDANERLTQFAGLQGQGVMTYSERQVYAGVFDGRDQLSDDSGRCEIQIDPKAQTARFVLRMADGSLGQLFYKFDQSGQKTPENSNLGRSYAVNLDYPKDAAELQKIKGFSCPNAQGREVFPSDYTAELIIGEQRVFLYESYGCSEGTGLRRWEREYSAKCQLK